MRADLARRGQTRPGTQRGLDSQPFLNGHSVRCGQLKARADPGPGRVSRGDTMRLRALFAAAAAGVAMAATAVAPQIASAAPGFATVGSVSITPNPVASEGSLHVGQAVKLTVTASTTSGAPDPFAYVWVQVDWVVEGVGPKAVGPTGTLTTSSPCLAKVQVGSANLHQFGCKYQVNELGELAMTYTAGSPLHPAYADGYEDYIYASRFSDPGVLSSPWTMSPYEY